MFVHYSLDEEAENNVSRVLAIILSENRLFSDRFTEMISRKLPAPLMKPESPEDFTVDIQRSASDLAEDLEGVARIIPVTLTPNGAVHQEGSEGSDNPIPDICIFSRNGETSDLIIIEVKIDSDFAESQSRHQAESIASLNKTGSEVSIAPVINLSWKDTAKLLLEVSALQLGDDLILAHYIEYLKQSYAGWFPASPFSVKMTDEFARSRLDVLANNCAAKLTSLYAHETFSAGGSFDENGRMISFSPSWDYLREFHIIARFGNDRRLTGITLAFWPGNNAGQSWQLFKGAQVDPDMSWTRNESINAGGESLALSVWPYLKFSHINGRFVMCAYPSADTIGTNKANIAKKFCPLNGTWTRDSNDSWSWDDLKRRILDGADGTPALLGGESAEAFRNDFAVNFEGSGRNFAYVSLGYEISIEIPASKLEELDKNFSHRTANQDSVADLVVSAVKALRDMIE